MSCVGSKVDSKGSRPNVNKQDREAKCGKCSHTVGDSDQAVECDICEVWYHIVCANIPVEVYEYMMDEENQDQTSWYCNSCKKGCVKLHKRIVKVEKTQVDIVNRQENLEAELSGVKIELREGQQIAKDVETRVGTVEARTLEAKEVIDKISKDSKELVDRLGSIEVRMIATEEKIVTSFKSCETNSEHVKKGNENEHTKAKELSLSESFIREVNDRRERENNFVVHGVAESTSTVSKEKIDSDKSFVKRLLQHCGVQSSEHKDIWVLRLGRPTSGKPRPLLVKQDDSCMKRDLFRNIRKLQSDSAYDQVKISHDLTKRERESEKDLWNEVKNLYGAGKGKHTVVGPPWKRRIVKVREQRSIIDTQQQMPGHQNRITEETRTQQEGRSIAGAAVESKGRGGGSMIMERETNNLRIQAEAGREPVRD